SKSDCEKIIGNIEIRLFNLILTRKFILFKRKDNVNHNKLLLKIFARHSTILYNKFDPYNRIFQSECDITTLLAV
ncbi:MAG: hypothetical protein ACRD6Q_07365, partial [Nitrososphaeraceae archaeon]